MIDQNQILERLRKTVPRLATDFIPERRLDALGADSIDLVELLVVIDSDFEVRLREDEFLNLSTVGELIQLIAERSPKTTL